MNAPTRITVLIGLALLLAGCASTQRNDTNRSASSAQQSANAMSMAPGQVMTGTGTEAVSTGQSTPGPSSAPGAAHTPSALAVMVCGPDIRAKVTQALALPSPPTVRSVYTDHLFSCTYRLPLGPLVLSVQQSPTKVDAGAYFVALRRQVGPTQPLLGLGERAYTTPTGIVVVIKDDLTLKVDATGLPAVFGTQRQKRTDLAYEIASDVLGCWTGTD